MATRERKRPATRITVERHYPNGGGRSDGWQVIVSNPLWLKASPVFATQSEACLWARDYARQEN